MNAVVYARFSSHRQGEQSIEGQVAEAERFAAAHGLTIVKVYADRAQTGRNDNREQFQLMLADAAKHAFDALIVWKTDRIGRNKEEIALNKYHLKKNGVKIYYVAEAIPDTPEGIILEAVIEGMAAYYSEQLSQNVRRGMKNSAQKGRYTGGTCPLGYTITADKKYEVDPKYAPVVRDIFQLYSEGKTITEIVKILNDRGLRTSRGHAFTHNSLRTVLKNKKYIGTYEYNGEVSIENSVPPIVDVDMFNKVQDLLAFNQKAGAHKKAKVDYILFGKIFCGKCGAGMTGICGTSKQKVKHHYYICSAKKKKLCTKRAVRQDWIETLVLKHLLRLVRNEDLLEFIAENTYQYFLAQNTDTTYTKSLQKALDETDRAINNLLRAIEAGIFNESTKERMNELEEQKKDLRLALAAAKLKEDLALKKEHIVFFLHQFAGMDYSDIDCQKRLIKTFLNSVFVYDDKVVLTFNYSGDDRTITLHEIDGGLGHSICIPSAVVHHEKTPMLLHRSFFIPVRFFNRSSFYSNPQRIAKARTFVRAIVLLFFLRHKIRGDGLQTGAQLGVFDPCGVQHPLGGQGGHGVGVLIAEVEDLFDTALDDGLGTFVAGEQGNVELTAPEVTAVGVENGVQLRMDHVRVLGLFAGAVPGEFVIGAALGHAVIAGGDDDVLLDTMQAPTWVLGSLLRRAASMAMPMKYSSQLM